MTTRLIAGAIAALTLTACAAPGATYDRDLEACSSFSDAVYVLDPTKPEDRAEISRSILAFNGPEDPELLAIQEDMASQDRALRWGIAALKFTDRCNVLSSERGWKSWKGVRTDKL